MSIYYILYNILESDYLVHCIMGSNKHRPEQMFWFISYLVNRNSQIMGTNESPPNVS